MKRGHCFVYKPSVASRLKKQEKYYPLLMELFHQEAQHVSNSMCQHLSALNSAYQQLKHSRSYYNLLEMTCDKMVFDQRLELRYCRGGQGEEVSRCNPTFCQQLLVRYKTILLPLHSQPHALISSHSEYVHFQTPLHLGAIEQQNVYITAECCMLSSGGDLEYAWHTRSAVEGRKTPFLLHLCHTACVQHLYLPLN